jgi:hypothetical protein
VKCRHGLGLENSSDSEDIGRNSQRHQSAKMHQNRGTLEPSLRFSGTWSRGTLGVGIARTCHRQKSGPSLISSVSSSGGGLPGVLDSKEFQGARYFLGQICLRSSSSTESWSLRYVNSAQR